MPTHSHAKIPVLDFSNEDLKPGTSPWLSARKDVCRALEEYGCFVAELGNRLPLELHNSMFGSVRELFDFPTETKKKVTSERAFHGYFPNTLYERMMIDNATAPEQIQKLANVFWPNGNEHFRESANSYVKLMEELDRMVTRMVFENYGVEKYYDSHMELTSRSLPLIKYNEPQKTGTNEGLGSHTDMSFASILHQMHVKGLEVKTKDGEWIVIDPSPSSFIFLAASGLQVWSNDRIQGCVHRVKLTENETRYSFALFIYHDGTLHVPEELVDEEHPLKYKPFNNSEFIKAQVGHRGELVVKAFCGV